MKIYFSSEELEDSSLASSAEVSSWGASEGATSTASAVSVAVALGASFVTSSEGAEAFTSSSFSSTGGVSSLGLSSTGAAFTAAFFEKRFLNLSTLPPVSMILFWPV